MTAEAERLTGEAERLTGVRVSYEDAPAPVHDWIEATLGGPVVIVRSRTGGMSPAMAVSLRAANGATAFVKAVGSHINPDTPSHFRHETEVLRALPPAAYRASLLSSYDDGAWVAIALEDVDGRHPDWSTLAERERLFETVLEQTAELTPVPDGMPSQSTLDGARKHLQAMVNATPSEIAGLPGWAACALPRLVDMCGSTIDRHRDEAFCHVDLRHDNLLIRHADGQPMLLDWGMSRRGQRWVDPVVFAIEWAASPYFDELVDRFGVTDKEQEDVTGFLAGLGVYLLIMATHPAPPGLPNLPEFRRQWGTDFLIGVRRRAGL